MDPNSFSRYLPTMLFVRQKKNQAVVIDRNFSLRIYVWVGVVCLLGFVSNVNIKTSRESTSYSAALRFGFSAPGDCNATAAALGISIFSGNGL